MGTHTTIDEILETLILSARYGDGEDIAACLDAGVNVNGQDERGSTALHMASANGHLDCMKLLLDHGASVDLCNNEGNSALHWACTNGHEDAVQLLMEKGAEPSRLNNFERTPVDDALDRGHQRVVDVIKSFAPATEQDEKDDIVEDEDDTNQNVLQEK